MELQSQAALDAFQGTYGPCTRIDGDLTIRGADISDLGPLSELAEVRGTLILDQNPALKSLQGLAHLGLVYSLEISRNDALADLQGLEALHTVYVLLQVNRNPSLTSLEGLSGLGTIGFGLELNDNDQLRGIDALADVGIYPGGELRITANPLLESLEGSPSCSRLSRFELVANQNLSSLAGVCSGELEQADRVSIQQNESIEDLQGLEALTSALDLTVYSNDRLRSLEGLALEGGGSVTVNGNPSLTSLEGLSGLVAVDELWVTGNAELSDCTALVPLLDVIDDGAPGPGPGTEHAHIPDVGDRVYLRDNHADCNSIERIAPLARVERVLTGSWYAPESAGEGFMIHAVREHRVRPFEFLNGLAVGYFYGYDPAGRRFWLIGTHEGPMEWDAPVRFTAIEASGGLFEGFDPGDVVKSEWGHFEFTPHHCSAGSIRLEGEFASPAGHEEKSLEVIRLAHVAGDYCARQTPSGPGDSITGSWYDPATSGQGFSIHRIDEDRGIVYFYGFDSAREPLWLIGQWSQRLVLGEPLLLDMIEVEGGTFDKVDPAQIRHLPWGTMILRLDGCASAYAELDGQDGKQVFFLTQLAGSLGLNCTP